MLLPVFTYGDPVLRKKTREIDSNYPDLHELIENMFETMDNANGIGLSAPQVGLPIRLFVIDNAKLAKEKGNEQMKEFKEVFINIEIINIEGKEWKYNEGCLSLPGIREDITRKSIIHVRYYDENFNLREKKFDEILARIILHEYDHIEGILFVDRLSSLKKRLLKRKLTNISKGSIDVDYPTLFPLKKTKA